MAAVLVLYAVVAPFHATASDNDEEPPYMIYIDPATGKYTTRDPQARHPNDYDAPATGALTVAATRRAEPAGPGAARTKEHSGVLVGGGLLLLAAAGATWHLRRRRMEGR